jgi:hypothetical protein
MDEINGYGVEESLMEVGREGDVHRKRCSCKAFIHYSSHMLRSICVQIQ